MEIAGGNKLFNDMDGLVSRIVEGTISLALLFGTPLLAEPLRAVDGGANEVNVLVDPNVRVSFEGNDTIHMEAPIAASATVASHLYAAAQVHFPGRPTLAFEPHLYVSDDSGAVWSPISAPIPASASWDNALAGGVDGAAYFVTHYSDRAGLTVFRTKDFGKTWTATNTNGHWDREYLALDSTLSGHTGNVYIVGELLGSTPKVSTDGVSVIASSDGGETFGAPVSACTRQHWRMATSPGQVVLSDGTLIVACYPYPPDEKRKDFRNAEVGVSVSRDGGKSFSGYIRVGKAPQGTIAENSEAAFLSNNILMGGGFPGLALAVAAVGAPHEDRVYAVWASLDRTPNPSFRRILLSFSDDYGRTWSRPHPVGGGVVGLGHHPWQANPMIAVNQDGIVGVAWFDDRNVRDTAGYDVYFSASRDGGLSFSPDTRVSSESSLIADGQVGSPMIDAADPSYKSHRLMTVDSAYLLRALGGDYAQMAVDAAGRFHPLWSDARDGGWQLYTSAIHVLKWNAPLHGHITPNADCNLDDIVEYIYGIPTWSKETHEAVIPVRLKNRSADPILAPIKISVESVNRAEADPNDSNPALTGADVYQRIWPPAKIVDKDGPAESATYNYFFNHSHPLFPDGVSDWQFWRFRIDRVGQMFFSEVLCATAVGREAAGR